MGNNLFVYLKCKSCTREFTGRYRAQARSLHHRRAHLGLGGTKGVKFKKKIKTAKLEDGNEWLGGVIDNLKLERSRIHDKLNRMNVVIQNLNDEYGLTNRR